ncbi:LacI family DNA-binding transcriptional regulator [Solirubrobacter sp. CPCC 204708]|uniref:LacI family transcriptional regulator n=1 Tax=Solirubrobacter deserti TaxID=2282478 RepID=A0ABT4RUH8_9ACTN|nr:LacI family DNA-binding transcriptional regulator [Solirubrobacter deserti]MBE2316354.1 LacI family DNA-binding transcriptional regulator [Solirubrobacter deserti]MDA0142115.1 LacI family transcriptional regulator [Solirubrobacter deserti]
MVSHRGRGPTIRDVARRAGVSAATVSRVLNDSPLVVEPTRARVRAAVDELGYRMNATARTLSLGRATAVGVVVPFFTTHSVIERLRGVVARLSGYGQRGYDLLLFDVEAPAQRADAMRDLADRNRVAGLLIVSLPIFDAEIDALQRDELPAVLLDVRHPRLPRVVVDNVRGGELAAEHLLAKGHSRIGFVGDHPTNAYGFTSSEDRRRGFGAALERAGNRLDPALQRFGLADREEAEVLTRSLLGRSSPPTAIFAASDLQAIGVLKGCEAMGARVPEDVAVIGFDDVDLAEIVGLTTIRQPLRESGEQAADLLIAAIEDGVDDPVEEVQQLTVVERRTT